MIATSTTDDVCSLGCASFRRTTASCVRAYGCACVCMYACVHYFFLHLPVTRAAQSMLI